MINIKNPAFQQAVIAAKEATHKSGAYLLERYAEQNHKIEIEGSHEKIVDDKIAEDIILGTLKEHLNNFSYISEETKLITEDDIQFIIDPIEGTANYARGIPFFATQIAIIYKGILAASFIYEPVKKIMYHAILGNGAYANDKKISVNNNEMKRLMLSGSAGSESKNKQALVNSISKIVPHVRSLRLYGSTGLELAYIAQGKLGIHINIGSKIYDYTPGVLLIREAGGVVLNMDGKEWKTNDKTLVTASKKVIKDIINLLK